MQSAEGIYNKKCNDNSDICQHMPVLRKYAEGLDIVIELGMRSIVSTWAFLLALPKALISVDIKHPIEYKEYDPEGCDLNLVRCEAERLGVMFAFKQEDSVKAELPVCDLMFFDTLHTMEQLMAELHAHGKYVNKYMIFHDTETYKDQLMPPINAFLEMNPEWVVAEKFDNNNGLLILKRI